MRLSIKLCRHCTRSKDECDYRKLLAAPVNAIDQPGTMMHNCLEYRKCWNIGDQVHLELFEIEGRTLGGYSGGDSGDYEPEYEECSWVSAGFTYGKIKELPFDHRGFFLIELFKPVSLCLPPLHSNRDWSKAEEVEVTLRMKHANKLTFVSRTPEQKPETLPF